MPQQIGRHLFPCNAILFRSGQCGVDPGRDLVRRNRRLFGHRIADHKPAQPQRPMRPRDPCGGLWPLQCGIDRQAAVAAVKGGKAVGAVTQNRNALGFQNLHRAGQIQDALRPGRHGQDRRPGQFQEICRNIHGVFRPSMHPADPTCRENADPGGMGADHRGGNRGRARAVQSKAGGEVPAAQFGDRRIRIGQLCAVLLAQSDPDAAVQHGDGRRHGSGLPDSVFHRRRGLQIVGMRQAVGDHGGFQCHNGRPVAQGIPDRAGQADEVSHGAMLSGAGPGGKRPEIDNRRRRLDRLSRAAGIHRQA